MADDPIIVGGSVLPTFISTLVRYIAAPVAGFLVGKGYITADDAAQVGGILLALATAGWGIWQAISNHSKLVTTANASPNNIAKVK